jgi:metal-responsive CopG/Arc/MetJ family transcriptional regulator
MAKCNIHISKLPVKKRGPGRPPKTDAANQTVPIQLSKSLIAKIDQWAAQENIGFRSTAIRHLIERGLAAETDDNKSKRKQT